MPLVVDSNSTCDICLERYTSANLPHIITCGHVYCQKCLDRLMQRICPLCRRAFSAGDVRKLHVDVAVAEGEDEDECFDASRWLLDDIVRAVEGGDVDEVRRVIDTCRAYCESQRENQYTPVRVSCLVLHKLLETQAQVVVQAELMRNMTAAGDEIQDRLVSELEVVQLKYEDLEHTRRDEREIARGGWVFV